VTSVSSTFADGGMVERRLWQLTSVLAGAAAALLVRKLARTAWRAQRHEASTVFDADRSVELRDALIFAAAVGAGTAVARLVAQRTAARAWEAATGAPPERFTDDS